MGRAFLQKRTECIFWGGRVLLGLTCLFAFRYVTLLLREDRSVERSHQILEGTEAALEALTQIESEQRGYALSGQARFLDDRRAAIRRVDQQLEKLGRATESAPRQRRRVEALKPLVARKLALLNDTLALRPNPDAEATRHLALAARGKEVMDAIRAVARAIRAEENAALRQRQADKQQSARQTRGVLIAGGLLAVFLVALAARLLRREIREQGTARQEIARQNTLLEQRSRDIAAQQRQAEHNAADLQNAMEMVAQTSRRFEEMFQGLPVACFCFDGEGRVLEWNRAFETLYGVHTEHVFQQRFSEIIGRAQDRERLADLVRSVCSGDSYEGMEWECVRRDGATRHVLSNMFPLRGAGGVCVGGISVHLDISDRKSAEAALRDSEQRWQLALRGNNDGIWDWNPQTDRVFFSARWKEMLGLEEDAALETRADWRERVHPDDMARMTQALDEHLRGATRFYSAEYRVRRRDGSYMWILDRGQALWNRTGDVVRIAGSYTDISERKRHEQQIEAQRRELQAANCRLELLATQDGLTGLKNHRAFQERLEQEFARARRYNTPLSLLLLDVDRFKQYNDAFGHPAGDDILREVAALLERSARTTDLVARYGGEEFVVVLPHTDGVSAGQVAERMRAAVAEAPWTRRAVTVSVGVAQMAPGLQDRSELIGAADRALYRSKARGRNRVSYCEVSHPISPVSSASP